MGSGHQHGTGSGHAHGGANAGRRGNRRRLALVLALVLAYIVVEVVGGLLTNSLALLADAGHMLSDAAALALSLFALWIAERPATPTRTYGYYRTEILAALVNGATLVAIAIYIFVEAIERFRAPPEVMGGLMMAIAAGGLVVNLAGLWILNAGRGESLNLQGAWLHVLTDALGSVGAVLGGALVYFFGWSWADPAVSVLIGLLVLYSSWSLLKDAVAVLMEGVPGGIDVDEVRDAIIAVPAVQGVHDLHVWSITSGLVALSAHVTVAPADYTPRTLKLIRDALHRRFGINHVTVQLEAEGSREPRSVV
ncbi:MAG: cation diffusion facilitator family transporter [Brachybacterium paraconglomeratum]|jgi:cobalt-zinc-cadmium efflux system protein|nr:cation diffusion facilitator family transporter [Brachybacterium paraconglomeratum]